LITFIKNFQKKKEMKKDMWNKINQVLYREKVVNIMEVTDVRLRRVNTEGRMKAIASITLDNEFVVHDIRVIDGNNGLFVAMPSKRTPDGEFRDIAHPINSATRGKIQEAILAEYHRLGKLEEELEEAGAS
jgi:stage V sporulation protein G